MFEEQKERAMGFFVTLRMKGERMAVVGTYVEANTAEDALEIVMGRLMCSAQPSKIPEDCAYYDEMGLQMPRDYQELESK